MAGCLTAGLLTRCLAYARLSAPVRAFPSRFVGTVPRTINAAKECNLQMRVQSRTSPNGFGVTEFSLRSDIEVGNRQTCAKNWLQSRTVVSENQYQPTQRIERIERIELTVPLHEGAANRSEGECCRGGLELYGLPNHRGCDPPP